MKEDIERRTIRLILKVLSPVSDRPDWMLETMSYIGKQFIENDVYLKSTEEALRWIKKTIEELTLWIDGKIPISYSVREYAFYITYGNKIKVYSRRTDNPMFECIIKEA